MPSPQTFETERLLLRPAAEEDAPFLLELLNTPKWLQYIGDRNVKTVEDAAQYIRTKMLPQLERLGYGSYTVIRKADQVKLGTCGLYDRTGLEAIDIGFAFLPAYEGKGYAFEAAQALQQAALPVFGITKLCAITIPGNTASQKLLKKLGFGFEQTVRLPNDPEELLLFSHVLRPQQADN